MFRVPTPRKNVVAVAFERGNGKDRQGYDDISSPAYTDVARTGQNLHSLEESNITSPPLTALKYLVVRKAQDAP